MIKQIFFLSLLVCCFFACTKQTNQEVEATPDILQKGVYSLDDFQALVDQDIYPINQLSEAAIEHFKAGLIFQEDIGVRGTDSEMIDKELDITTKKALFELLRGGEVIFIEDISEIETSATSRENKGRAGYILIHHRPILCSSEANPRDCCGFNPHQECFVPWVF